MSTKALKTQLLAAVAMVLVASVALGSSTYAWFAANRTVTATDMKVTAQTTGSLVIAKGALPTNATTAITVSAEDTSATALIPATHDLTTAKNTGLVYNTNSGNVSANTGLVETGKAALTFAEATNGDGKTYYKDYIVFIAANGASVANQDIKAKISSTASDTLTGATSIDFYVLASTTDASTSPFSDANYGGTLNLAGLKPDTSAGDKATDEQTEITVSGASGVTVPKADGASAVAVLMRVYIDGALKDTETTTFVKNVDVAEIQDTTLGVEFSAVDHT